MLDLILWNFVYSGYSDVSSSHRFLILSEKKNHNSGYGLAGSNSVYKVILTCHLPESTFYSIMLVQVTAPGYRCSPSLPVLCTKKMQWWTLEPVSTKPVPTGLCPPHHHLPDFRVTRVPLLSLHPNMEFAPNKETHKVDTLQETVISAKKMNVTRTSCLSHCHMS